MGSIGEAFANTVPAVGTSGTAYASSVNALLDEIVARLNVKVPVGSIAAAQADLNMNGNSVLNMDGATFTDLGTPPSGAPYGRIAYANGEFYLITPSGGIRLTSEGAIDVSTTGGIGGDYGSGQELADYDTAGELYTFWADLGAFEYAVLKARGFHAVDEVTGRMGRIKVPTSIAATYDFILPANDPASGVSVLVMDNAGQVGFADLVAPTNDARHGAVELAVNLTAQYVDSTGTPAFDATSLFWGGNAVNVFMVEFVLPPIPVGRRLTGAKMRIDQGAASTATMTVYKVSDGGAPSSLGSANTSLVGAPQTVTLSGLTETIAFTECFKVRVAFTGGAAGIVRKLIALSYTYDYPV